MLDRSWQTGDPQGFNKVVYLDGYFEQSFVLFDRKRKRLIENMYVNNNVVTWLGPRDANLSYAGFEVTAENGRYHVEYAKENTGLLTRISALAADASVLPLLVSHFAWETRGGANCANGVIVSKVPDRVAASVADHCDPPCGHYQNFEELRTGLAMDDHLRDSDHDHPLVARSLEGAASVTVATAVAATTSEATSAARKLLARAGKILESNRKACEKKLISFKSKQAPDFARAIPAVLQWSLSWDPLHRQFYMPVNKAYVAVASMKHECADASTGPAILPFDAFLAALSAAVCDGEVAKVALESIFTCQQYNGKIPRLVVYDKREPISHPPVAAYVLWKLYRLTGDRELLEKYYKRTVDFYHWLETERDRNRDGLLEWGVDNEPENLAHPPDHSYAAREAGFGDVSLWHEAPFNARLLALEMGAVDLNSLYALGMECLARSAAVLGKTADAKRFTQAYKRMRDSINRKMWDDENHMYANRLSDGRLASVRAATSFYPFIAGVPDRERADRAIRNSLLNPDLFYEEHMLTFFPFSPRFRDKREDTEFMRIWPSVNFLVFEGLRRYDSRAAHLVASSSLDAFRDHWEKHSHVPSSLTMYTHPQAKRFARHGVHFHTCGGLVPLMAVCELIDVELDEGLRFGSPLAKFPGTLENVRIAGATYRVVCDEKSLAVYRNRRLLIRTTPRVEVRRFVKEPKRTAFELVGNGEVAIVLGSVPAGATLLVNKKPRRFTREAGKLRAEVNLTGGSASVVVGGK